MRVCALAVAALIAGTNTGRISVGAFPTALAVGQGSVWVLAGGRVVRVDPVSGRLLARISVGVRLGSERSCGLSVAGGRVWAIGAESATRSRLVRIDARTGRPLGATVLPSAACVAATTAGAWLTLPAARELVRLDRDGRIVQRLPTDAYCDAIVAGHGAVWAACPEETAGAPIGSNTGTILRIDGHSVLTVVARDVLAGALAAGPAGVFASGINHDSGTTVRLDRPGVHFPGSGAIAVGRSSLWAVDWRGPGQPGYVREINPLSGRLVRSIPAGFSPLGVALTAGAVWVSNYTAAGTLTRIKR